jgi:tetratricopeptide (TPR) repeat protein
MKNNKIFISVAIICLIVGITIALGFLYNKSRPFLSSWYVVEGAEKFETEDFDEALSDFNMAILFDPENAFPYIFKGLIYCKKGIYEKALESISEAINLLPENTPTYCYRGLIYECRGEYEKAILDYKYAIKVKFDRFEGYNNLAWIYATCPSAQYRNGKLAVTNATKACDLTEWNDYTTLDTLAAAYAEINDFGNAIHWVNKALILAPENMKNEIQSHLDLFKKQKPYREKCERCGRVDINGKHM